MRYLPFDKTELQIGVPNCDMHVTRRISFTYTPEGWMPDQNPDSFPCEHGERDVSLMGQTYEGNVSATGCEGCPYLSLGQERQS
jgi:hypothetical protein